MWALKLNDRLPTDNRHHRELQLWYRRNLRMARSVVTETFQAMPLMDAYACNFCRHILEANLEQQTVHIVDGVQPMGWRWLGWRWQPLYQSSADVTITLWVVGIAIDDSSGRHCAPWARISFFLPWNRRTECSGLSSGPRVPWLPIR